MTEFRQVITAPLVCEKTTALLELQLTDQAGVNLTSADLSTVTLTLYPKPSGTILNSRNAQSILGMNGGSVSAGGLLSLILSHLDNTLERQGFDEEHVALIEYTWASGTRFGKKEITFTVANTAKIT